MYSIDEEMSIEESSLCQLERERKYIMYLDRKIKRQRSKQNEQKDRQNR